MHVVVPCLFLPLFLSFSVAVCVTMSDRGGRVGESEVTVFSHATPFALFVPSFAQAVLSLRLCLSFLFHLTPSNECIKETVVTEAASVRER